MYPIPPLTFRSGRKTLRPMSPPFSDAELEAYLDEALAPADMLAIEHALRTRPELIQQLAALNSRRNSGVHTLGEIWRRHRLSCPTRDEFQQYLDGKLDEAIASFLRFHVDTVGCRFCQANLEDLRQRIESQSDALPNARRRGKIRQASAPMLKSGQRPSKANE